MKRKKSIAVGTEQHFSTRDLARRWRRDISTVRRVFKNEPGVLQFRSPTGRVSLRVPRTIVEKFEREIVVAAVRPSTD